MKVKCVNSVFEEHINYPIDRVFMARMLEYVEKFERKNSDHIHFLGSGLLGVYQFKWLKEDEANYVIDVLQINDFDKLQNELYSLPDINRDFNVSSNALNLSFLFIAYKALTSTILTLDQKEHLARAAITMLQYKFLSSIHTRRFPHRANESAALALFESLDNKTHLKKYGTWKALIAARTEDILGEDRLHKQTIRTLEPDHKIVGMLNDIWTRLKSIMNSLMDNFTAIRQTQTRVLTSSKFQMVEGEEILKEYTSRYQIIKEGLINIVPDRNAFIKDDLIDIIPTVINTVYPAHLKETLYYLSNNFNSKKINGIQIIDDILQFTLTLIRKENIPFDSIPAVALKLRSSLRSSRLISDDYNKIKRELDEIVEAANPKIQESHITSCRIGVILYITLRALLKK